MSVTVTSADDNADTAPTTEPPVVDGEATEVVNQPTVEDPPAQSSDSNPKPWVARRIDDLTRQRYDAQRRAEAAEQEANRLRQELARRGARPPVTAPASDPPEVPSNNEPPVDNRAIEQRAQELIKIREFNERCDVVYRAGKTEHSDFDAVLETFNSLGGLQPHVIEAVLEADQGNAHKILYDLGKDPDTAYRLLNETNPFRLAREVIKLSQKYQAPPKPAPLSKAPPPPSGGVRSGAPAAPEVDPDKMTTAQWMEWRQKTKKVR